MGVNTPHKASRASTRRPSALDLARSSSLPSPSPSTSAATTDEPVASTSQLPPRLPASLATLPPELKMLIVQKVAEADMADIEGDDDEGAWSDEDGEDDTDEVEDEIAEGMTELDKKGWDLLRKLPQDEAGNPTEEALLKVRERLLELAKMSGIEALTLVSRDFSEMAMPYFWQELDFGAVSNEEILFLIKEVLPRRARHVQSLAFGQSEAHMLRDDPPGTSGAYDAVDPYLPLPPRRAAIVEAAEELGGVKAQFNDGMDYSSELRCRRTRGLLMAEVVRQCTNVVRVDCEAFPRVPPSWVDELEERDLGNRNVVYEVDHAVEAIKTHLGDKLTDLTFLVNDDGVTTEGEVADLLLRCPNLFRLELELLVPSGPATNRERLFDAFTRLTKLESLNVVEGGFVTDEFASLDLNWPLKVLALSECEDLSFPSFFTLVQRFAPTLECLDLSGTPHSNSERLNKKFLGRPLALPKLDTLVLETPHEAALLDSFAQCPLATFGLGFCPAIEYADIERFMDVHAGTLRRIEVESDAALSAGQVESLEVLCHARGIECELLEPDESDSDDDSEFGSDEDDMDPEEWLSEDEDEVDDDDWSDEDGE
ncbi:hypothetical protein JCM10207_003340 [Rhodosporidiobolus poonsookiae]